MKSITKRVIAVAVMLAIAAAVLFINRQEAQTAYTKDIFAMDTYFSLKAYGPSGEEALKLCEERIQKLESDLSVTLEGSDIWNLNYRDAVTVSDDTYGLIAEALKLCEETGGALDITLYPVLREWGFTTDEYHVPDEKILTSLLEKVDYRAVDMEASGKTIMVPEGMELDLGAVAKGYTGDCLLEILREQNVESAMVDLGGNVQVLGSKPDGSPWKVAVRDPFDTSSQIGVLEVTDKAVITSGGYERYFEENGQTYWHILNPADGYPADSGLLSVTVVGESGVRCDGLSTALFVMGMEEAVNFWRTQEDFEMLLVTEDGALWITEGLQENFECSEGWNAEIIYREINYR